jgi:hypothetical protein
MPGVENLRTALPFGLAALDSHLPLGGLACGALHEVVPAEGAASAAFGFIVAILACAFSPPPLKGRSASEASREGGHAQSRPEPLTTLPGIPAAPRGDPFPPPQGGREQSEFARTYSYSPTQPIIFVMPAYGLREYGRPYGHGLNALALDPARLILVETAHRKDSLWALEEALHSRAPAAIAGMIDQLDLKLSQRLQLAATAAGLPLFLLRPAQNLESSAAATRWRVGNAPAARDRFGLLARPRWHLQLERCRNGRPGEWMVEYDHVAHRFSLAAALVDPARSRRAGEKALRQAHRS